jgi:hypothetical protein
LDVTGNETVGGTLDVTGASTLTGNLDVTGNETVGGTLYVTGASTLTGNLDVTGNETVGGTLDVTGASTLTGNVGIGGASGSEKLLVTGNVDITGNLDVGSLGVGGLGSFFYVKNTLLTSQDPSLRFQSASNNTTNGSIMFVANSTNNRTHITFKNDTQTGNWGSITSSSSSTRYNTSSDYRLKENLENVSDALTILNQLKCYKYNFIDSSEKVLGFLAHEVQEVLTGVVVGEKDEIDQSGNPVFQQMDHSKMVPFAISSIQEVNKQLQEEKEKTTKLQNQYDDLLSRVVSLENNDNYQSGT